MREHPFFGRLALVPVFAVALVAGLSAGPATADVGQADSESPTVLRALVRAPGGASAARFGMSNASCAGVECDTVWVGHSSAGPGGAFLGVGVGGVWNFDDEVAGTDSSQGWRFWPEPYRSGTGSGLADKHASGRDYGNVINLGDQNLWDARALAGRRFVKTGVSGAWHADDMAGVKRKLNDPAEPSATPIAGARSAWCGLREAGNTHPDGLDPLTGNYRNGDLVFDAGGIGFLPEFPGYGSLWDQMLYKDFPGSTGAGSVSFRVRTDMSNFVDTVAGGSGWFNPFPEPELASNFVLNPADSFMVYVGTPNDVAYDVNRRWFSEVLDLTKPHAELFAVSGVYPFLTADTAITRAYAGLEAGTIRVVFRVKTNRVRSDQTTSQATGYNSKQGAALVDDVAVDGGPAEGFETTAQVRARSLIPDLAAAGGPWATTGRPPHVYMHVENVLASGLAYEDLCGAIGTPTRLCNLTGNVFLAGNHDDPNHVIPCGPSPKTENRAFAESPTIDLAVRTAAPGTKNAQGIDQAAATRTEVVIDFDFYSGHMDIFDESVWYFPAIRVHGPAYVSPVSGHRVWTGTMSLAGRFYNPDPLCTRDGFRLSGIGAQLGSIDSLKVGIHVETQAYRFGGTNLGDTRGTYFDNLRVGFVRTTGAMTASIEDQWQDQFPWNEAVTPGDNAAFDTTAALLHTGRNLSTPGSGETVPGDSLLVLAPGTGDGTTTGTRVDFVFRIDPGPGNYSDPGNRASPLVERDPAHPFFTSYLADNGAFGTPGGHGSAWNRHVWNSARMDSAELNLHPIQSRSIGGPVASKWMSTLHESDPRYATLGVLHNVCFLVNPAGPGDDTNIACNGTAPAAYGAVPGTSREGTKILPDGWFTPGTHIEYFVRRSRVETPAEFTTLFDTSRVTPQDLGEALDLDADRWHSVDVLPDMWKSARYGGAGLACMLLVDGSDRRGSEPAYVGAADTTGYGKNDGSKKGWKGLGPNSDPNDPAGFVAANGGQAGLNFDLYEIRYAEFGRVGRPGSRFASLSHPRRDTSGPSPAMLAAFYSHVLHFSGDIDFGAIHDGVDQDEIGNDVALYDAWLAGSTSGNRRGLWLSGDGIAEDGSNSDPSGLPAFLVNRMGASLVDPDYKLRTSSQRTTIGLLPLAPWAHPGRVYGLSHLCTAKSDVIHAESTIDGAMEAARYEALGPGTEFGASVARPAAPGREYRTLLDGFDLAHLRGHAASLAQVETTPGTDIGRLAWFDDALSSHLEICARRGAVVAVGDLPGLEGARFANVNLGAAPNPAFAGKRIALRFTLARPVPVTVRILNVAGREVARLAHEGLAGPNDVVWDGTLSSGARAAAGVYFYRIEGAGFGDGAATSKLVILGR